MCILWVKHHFKHAFRGGKNGSSEKKNENTNRSHLNASGVHLDTMYFILIYKNTQKEVLYLKPSLIWLDATNYSLDLVQINKTTVQDSDEAPYVLCCTIYVPI